MTDATFDTAHDDTASFSEVIHAPIRFRICGLLRGVDRMTFPALRDVLDIGDDVLSKHLRTLAQHGFVTTTKETSADRSDKRKLTWVALTRAGRSAFTAHLAALQQLAEGR